MHTKMKTTDIILKSGIKAEKIRSEMMKISESMFIYAQHFCSLRFLFFATSAHQINFKNRYLYGNFTLSFHTATEQQQPQKN